jgi:hypothetical protein
MKQNYKICCTQKELINLSFPIIGKNKKPPRKTGWLIKKFNDQNDNENIN